MKENTAIVLGTLLAAAVPAIVGGLQTPIYGGIVNTDIVSVFGLALVFYPFSLAFACLFGLPLFWLSRHYHLVRWWSALIAGLLAGAAGAVVIVGPRAAMASNIVTFAIEGAASALLFFVIWRASVRT